MSISRVVSVALTSALLFVGLGAAPAQAEPVQLSIGTFNVKDPDANGCGAWTKRGPVIAQQILSRKLNVIGVQEVFERQDRSELLYYINAEAYKTQRVKPYAMTFPADRSSVAERDFNTTGYDNRLIYDTRRVTLVATWAKRFGYQSPGDNKYGRHMMWALFENNLNKSRFLVFNTHTAPGDDVADQKQWTELISYMKAWRDRYKVPVFAIGDFNSTKFEGASRAMLPAMRAAGVGDILGQQYRSYTTAGARIPAGGGNSWVNSFNNCRQNIREFSVARNRPGNSPDYIFASNNIKVLSYLLVVNYDSRGYLKLPIPSDHFLLTTTVELP